MGARCEKLERGAFQGERWQMQSVEARRKVTRKTKWLNSSERSGKLLGKRWERACKFSRPW